MKFTSIPQLYRNLRRWQEILAVLRRYGLAGWLSHFPQLPFRDYLKDSEGLPLTRQSREVRIRKALTELGPTFIKLGQTLSARPDLVGPTLAEELESLRADVLPDPPQVIRRILAEELGELMESEIVEFDETPIAAASIGQVHAARLRDGTDVVLKIQRDGIEAIVRQDLDVLAGLAQLAERVPAFAAWGPVEMVRQLSPMLRRELDFEREHQNLLLFAEFFRDTPEIAIPIPIDHLCTRRVLTMTRFRGASLNQWMRYEEPPAVNHPHRAHHPEVIGQPEAIGHPEAIGQPEAIGRPEAIGHPEVVGHPRVIGHADGVDDWKAGDPWRPDSAASRRALGEVLARCYMRMIFDYGLFHADPHPGNFVLLEDGRLGILDFGMVGRIDDRLRETIEEMMVATTVGDQRSLTRLMKRVGNAPAEINDMAFSSDVSEFIGTYGRQGLDKFDLSAAIDDLSAILHRHGIKLPHQSALMLKMLVSLEGTLRGLQADFDTLTVMRQFVRRAMLRRLNPKRRLQQARRIYLEAENFLEVAPDQFLSLLEQVRQGRLRVSLEHIRVGPTVNRLVLGLIASALFLGSALLLAQQVPPLLFPESTFLGMHRLSLFGLTGAVLSLLEMVRLMRAIRRSGALSREEE
ncbi:ABC1 kinase family protein [Candidatus Laterigemmans baculatus]|uniref:ABC1 kinase family protein n=1 Tax=Candidatus Laterigemmans baculatus TaxID=2770505 RepID=UPI001F267E61|nr:AarF/UbiB family protein [Candidatus Laterigemmans baculatus]